MATIIPRLIPSDAPNGEKDIFHKLKTSTQIEDWIVLHGLDIASHITQIEGEADFVIIVPNHGILVLEDDGFD